MSLSMSLPQGSRSFYDQFNSQHVSNTSPSILQAGENNIEKETTFLNKLQNTELVFEFMYLDIHNINGSKNEFRGSPSQQMSVM